MRTFGLLLSFVLLGVCLGAEQKPATTSQAKELTYETLGDWPAWAKDEDPALRIEATRALEKIGPPAIPVLMDMLKDKDSQVRGCAACALSNIRPKPRTSVPVFTESLKDRNEQVRWAAAAALGSMGPDAKAAIPALLELIRDERNTDDVSASPGRDRTRSPSTALRVAEGQGRQEAKGRR